MPLSGLTIDREPWSGIYVVLDNKQLSIVYEAAARRSYFAWGAVTNKAMKVDDPFDFVGKVYCVLNKKDCDS